MVVPDDDVGVLADLQGADPVVDPELLRWIDGHHPERLVLREAAPFDRLGRFRIEPPRVLGAVGVDGDEDAFARHDRGVLGNRVDRLDFVRPPVGEGRRPCTVRRDLLRDLVPLEHVLERGDLEAHLLCQPDEHEDLVRAITVRVHQAFALENLHEWLQLKIAAWRNEAEAWALLRVELLPRLLIRLGAGEGVADHELDAQSSHRVAPGDRLGAGGHVLRVLAESELDPRHRAVELDLVGPGLAPSQLDHLVLPADGIRAAVQHVGRRRAARQVAIDVDVGRVEHVLHARHRAHRRAAFVDGVVRDVRVCVDDARRNELSGGVDDLGAGGHRDVRANGGDLPVPKQHRAIWNRAVGDGQDRSTSERDEPPGCGGLDGLTLNTDGGDRNQGQQRAQSQKPDRRVSAGHANLLVSRKKRIELSSFSAS
jgi:hypothetical protein